MWDFQLASVKLGIDMRRAVVLLSGGLDSTTTLAIAAHEGFEIYALTFDYGQKHKKEIESAKKIAGYYNAKEHKILKIDLSWAESALTNEKIDVPDGNLDDIGEKIPTTYVPARNIILLSFALAWSEVIKADAIFIGANIVDYSGYPDCRQEFFKKFQEMAELGTKRGVEGKMVEIRFPLIDLTKAKIIKKGMELNVPYHLTWSCYRGAEKACGKCDSCLLRLRGFKEAGYKDPIEYEVR